MPKKQTTQYMPRTQNLTDDHHYIRAFHQVGLGDITKANVRTNWIDIQATLRSDRKFLESVTRHLGQQASRILTRNGSNRTDAKGFCCQYGKALETFASRLVSFINEAERALRPNPAKSMRAVLSTFAGQRPALPRNHVNPMSFGQTNIEEKDLYEMYEVLKELDWLLNQLWDRLEALAARKISGS
ncbi:hypothetical protein OHC33_000332 [Knufia fluminis]|uniref:Uncharacterized protein n=1 Tax=Knufia fluminis TaxID=191047 RepID=A0AAN8I981_9EURO|nr:hypothetical protein OHC33_000332 [Knufia fluminis]